MVTQTFIYIVNKGLCHLFFHYNGRTVSTGSERLVVALDGVGPDESVRLSDRLRDRAGLFKVGPGLYHAGGADLLRRLAGHGVGIFLDLKFHDIPRTVRDAVAAVAVPPVRLLTVHASGGDAMLRAAAAAAGDTAGTDRVRILAVTILTSLGPDDLARIGITRPLTETAVALARAARDAGIDGVVCSGREAASIRRACGDGFLICTPGIRPVGGTDDDQVRIVTPAAAIGAGADYLVVGRPIITDPDPRAAADRIVAEIEAAARPA